MTILCRHCGKPILQMFGANIWWHGESPESGLATKCAGQTQNDAEPPAE